MLEKKSKGRIIELTVIEVSQWLDEFNNALGAKKILINSDFVENKFIRLLSDFKSKNVLEREELRFLARLGDIAGSIVGMSVLLPPMHGDLWGGSLLWGLDKRLHVIDWEFFKAQGLPLYDFLYFAVHPGFTIHTKNENGLFGEFMNLFHDNYFSGLICEHLKTHAKAAGVESPEVIELLLAVLLVRLSL